MNIENLIVSDNLYVRDLEELKNNKPELEYLSQFFLVNGYSNICDKILKVLDFLNWFPEIEKELELLNDNVFRPICKFNSFDIEKSTAERIINKFESKLESERKK